MVKQTLIHSPGKVSVNSFQDSEYEDEAVTGEVLMRQTDK